MLIEAGILSGAVTVIASVIAGIVVVSSIALRPWRGWLDDPERRAVWIGSLAMLAVVWSLHAVLAPGWSQRFLLITAATLLHGRALTILGATLVLALLCALGLADWTSFGPSLLCTAIVPALFSGRLHEIVHTRLPLNYFVYFFVAAFLGAALAWNVAALVRWLLLALSGAAPISAHSWNDYLVVVPLMSFGEAFLNGIVIAGAVVFRPHWVMSFDDRLYLARPSDRA